jgi:hypothetical protein
MGSNEGISIYSNRSAVVFLNFEPKHISSLVERHIGSLFPLPPDVPDVSLTRCGEFENLRSPFRG